MMRLTAALFGAALAGISSPALADWSQQVGVVDAYFADCAVFRAALVQGAVAAQYPLASISADSRMVRSWDPIAAWAGDESTRFEFIRTAVRLESGWQVNCYTSFAAPFDSQLDPEPIIAAVSAQAGPVLWGDTAGEIQRFGGMMEGGYLLGGDQSHAWARSGAVGDEADSRHITLHRWGDVIEINLRWLVRPADTE